MACPEAGAGARRPARTAAARPSHRVRSALVQVNSVAPGLFQGKKTPISAEEYNLYTREKFLLYVACIESKPGFEPKSVA